MDAHGTGGSSSSSLPARKDGRVILHFDYDSFYASVFEASNPALKSLPLAVQQKQIIVTCNYAARARGLYKLQLVRDARAACPDLIVELGEDISRFRDASKELFHFLRAWSWNGRVERLGFDEVWMDVSDLVDWNLDAARAVCGRAAAGGAGGHGEKAFFVLKRDDPTLGFEYDPAVVAGGVQPKTAVEAPGAAELALRLRLGSHLAMHIRHRLEEEMGYTSTVGIATNKLLAKLVGNVDKPKAQTTLMPPLEGGASTVLAFLDAHDIGKIPGIGFKTAQKLREFFLQRPAEFDEGLVYGGTKEKVLVGALRKHPDVCPEMLEKLLAGPGSPHGIGSKIWSLLHGIDDTEVESARLVPRQISIEDSYIRLDTMPELVRELTSLASSLINRMRVDILGDQDDSNKLPQESLGAAETPSASKRWLAHPRTVRLTTRPRQPLRPDGTRVRSFKRISHSGPLPNFVFNLHDPVSLLAERLVHETLLNMFRKLHPEKSGWNLSLVNLAVTNMAEAAGESKTASGRDIGSMFRRQEDVLKDFRVVDFDDEIEDSEDANIAHGKEDGEGTTREVAGVSSEEKMEDGSSSGWDDIDDIDDHDASWDETDDDDLSLDFCTICHSHVPCFAMVAHQRFHAQGVSIT